MKKFGFLILLSLFIIQCATAQNTEYSVHLNSGLFSFGGESATKSSIIIVSDIGSIDNYTNNPYGTESAFSYGMAAQIRRITGHKLLLGLQAGYEMLRSKVHINGVSGEYSVTPEVVDGHTVLSHGFMTLYPHLGKRFTFTKVEADLVIGPEFGFNTVTREKGEANLGNNTTVETDTERNSPGTDIRITPSLTVYYNNWGISAGYSYGLHNYSADLIGGNRERYSRFFRFGITYRIK